MKKYIVVKFQNADRVLTDHTWLEHEINTECKKRNGNLIQVVFNPVPVMIIEILC